MDLKANTQTPLSAGARQQGARLATLSISPDVTVAAAAEVLIRNQVGSVLVHGAGAARRASSRRETSCAGWWASGATRPPPRWPT